MAIAVERPDNLLPQHIVPFTREASSFLEKACGSIGILNGSMATTMSGLSVNNFHDLTPLLFFLLSSRRCPKPSEQSKIQASVPP